tara:strand:- start:19235 stop:20467 length:1233 start_codon:yes stop_codon:yes gene_type:complete
MVTLPTVQPANVLGSFVAGNEARQRSDMNALQVQGEQSQQGMRAMAAMASVYDKARTPEEFEQGKQALRKMGIIRPGEDLDYDEGYAALQAFLPADQLPKRHNMGGVLVDDYGREIYRKPEEVDPWKGTTTVGGVVLERDGQGGVQEVYRAPDKPSIPSGYEPDPSGGLRPIRGGPADKPGNLTDGAPAGYRWTGGDAATLEPIPGGPKDASSAGVDVKGEADLRKEFVKAQGDFIKVRDAFGRIRASASDPSAAGDLALIFNYMKVLDPGSTVREGEFATAQNAGGVGQQILGIYNRVNNGERLTESQRSDFLARARKLYSEQERFFERDVDTYRGLAEQYGFDPSRVVPDIGGGFDGGGATSSPQSQPGGPMFDGVTEGMPVGTRLQNPNDPNEVVEWNGTEFVPVTP